MAPPRRFALPPAVHSRLIVRYAALLWLALRVALWFMGERDLHWSASAALGALPAGLVVLDMHVLREWTLYRNWGAAPWWPPLLAVVTAGFLEIAARAALHLAGAQP